MEVFSKGELLRKTEELYDYKYFKYIYTNNDHFYVWSSPIHHRTVREEVIYKEEKVKVLHVPVVGMRGEGQDRLLAALLRCLVTPVEVQTS